MHKVKNEIKAYDTYNLNKNPNADTNFNYDIIFNDIVRAKDKRMPTKVVTFNKNKYNTIYVDYTRNTKINTISRQIV